MYLLISLTSCFLPVENCRTAQCHCTSAPSAAQLTNWSSQLNNWSTYCALQQLFTCTSLAVFTVTVPVHQVPHSSPTDRHNLATDPTTALFSCCSLALHSPHSTPSYSLLLLLLLLLLLSCRYQYQDPISVHNSATTANVTPYTLKHNSHKLPAISVQLCCLMLCLIPFRLQAPDSDNAFHIESYAVCV